MEFQEEMVYTALNADKLKVGSKVVVADNMKSLRTRVESAECFWVRLDGIRNEDEMCRFVTDSNSWMLCYLISEPEKKKLKWTDLKVGDIISNGRYMSQVLAIDFSEKTGCCHVSVPFTWLSDKELEGWEKIENFNEEKKDVER